MELIVYSKMPGNQLAPNDQSRPGTKTRRLNPKIPAWVAWVRNIGFFSILSGGVGLIQPQTFWVGVTCIYGGLLLLGVDLYFEPQLKRRFKVVSGITVVGVIALFSKFIVLIPAPIDPQAFVTMTQYFSGTAIAGISWRPFFTELDAIIENPTDSNYDDMNVLLRPDYPVAEIAQLSNLSNVSFDDYYGETTHGWIQNLSQNAATATTLLATNAGYKIHCGRIPPKSSLRIVMAIVDMKKAEIPHLGPPIQHETTAADFVILRVHDKKFIYWYGIKDKAHIYNERPSPEKLNVVGSYVANNRKYHFDKEISLR